MKSSDSSPLKQVGVPVMRRRSLRVVAILVSGGWSLASHARACSSSQSAICLWYGAVSTIRRNIPQGLRDPRRRARAMAEKNISFCAGLPVTIPLVQASLYRSMRRCGCLRSSGRIWFQPGAGAGSGVETEREAPGFRRRSWFVSIPEEGTGFLMGGLPIGCRCGARGLPFSCGSETRGQRQVVGEGIPIAMLLAYPCGSIQALEVPFHDEGGALVLDAAFVES